MRSACDTNEAHFEFVRQNYPVLDYFDRQILSYEVGSLKPDRKIFEHAIEASECAPDALFFTDDKEENILAASQFGIHTHQFQTEPKLIEALKEAGVLFFRIKRRALALRKVAHNRGL